MAAHAATESRTVEERLGSFDSHGRSLTAALDYNPAADFSRLADLTKRAVVQSLRQAGAALDCLFLEATTQGAEEALRLSDAAQAVHRALVALA